MKNKIFIMLSLAVSITVSSCNDSFLELKPKTEIGAESFFKTENDLKMYCYGLMNTPGFGRYGADAGTDNQATTDNVEVKNMMTSTNPNSITIAAGWNWERLFNINFFLEYCDRANVTKEVLNHYKGIARFYRANFYMDKVKRFSDVPWYEHIMSTDDKENLFKPRDSRETVVDKIFEDYNFAAQNVKTDQPKGSVDKWIVLATISRNALYEGTFRKYHDELNLQPTANKFLDIAVDAASKVMNEGNFSIYNTGNAQTDYFDLFNSLDLTNNPEIIEARYHQKGLSDNGFWANNFGNYIPCPTKDLVQSYLMSDGSYYSSQPNYERNQFVQEFTNRDPRISQTLVYPGWELKNPMTYAPGAGIYVQNLNKNFSGYHQLKGFINDKDEEFNQSVDFPSIRYAEVLLNYAEAKSELGSLSQTDLDISINLLRDRAALPHMPLHPTEEPLIAAKYPNTSTQLREIRRERRVELALEGFRFDDLMRWKAGKLIEKEPEGLYFPSLGKFDLTGDGVADIYLIPSSQSIPADSDKEVNSLGVKLMYYKTGSIDDVNATVYLKNGTSGNILTIKEMGTFEEPKFYYRPIPKTEIDLNNNLAPQLFGWD